MKYLLLSLCIFVFPVQANTLGELGQYPWNHGAEDCSADKDPAIDIFQYSESTYILRQNKCVHFEAPFIYVLFGEHTVFVQDTGATADTDKFPLYETLQKLIAQRVKSDPSKDMSLLVTHSHSHGDHTAGDSQFLGKTGVTLIAPDSESVKKYFGFTGWPGGRATIELGERELFVFPIPGHQDESIAIYDPQTRWILSGDTFYPGRLYIKDWKIYKESIQRLLEFSNDYPVSALLGTHIEMSSNPGKDYPRGSTYQPDETGLALSVEDLRELHTSLKELGDKPQEKVLAKVIIYPIGAMQRYIGGFLSWVKKLVN